MKNTLLTALLSLVLALVFTACESTATVNLGLDSQDSLLAKKVSDQWQPIDGNVFAKGDTVGLVLIGVSGFKKGDDGLNRMDLDVEVRDSGGKVIISETDVLGETGHIDLKDNTAESPVGLFQADSTIDPGNYKIKVTVKDMVGGGKVSVTKSFTIK